MLLSRTITVAVGLKPAQTKWIHEEVVKATSLGAFSNDIKRSQAFSHHIQPLVFSSHVLLEQDYFSPTPPLISDLTTFHLLGYNLQRAERDEGRGVSDETGLSQHKHGDFIHRGRLIPIWNRAAGGTHVSHIGVRYVSTKPKYLRAAGLLSHMTPER